MMFRFDRYVPLSLSRLWVRELAYFASKVPTAGGTALLKVKAGPRHGGISNPRLVGARSWSRRSRWSPGAIPS